MAEISALERALVNADAAGDTAAARVLAGEITRMRGAPVEAPPDKYQQAAIDEQADLKAKGIDPGAGLTRRLVHGATMGADSTILAGAMTPLEMLNRGTIDPREGYNYAKAREDRVMDDARKNTGALGTAAEILGGGVSGAGLAARGLTAARWLAPEAGLIPRAAASAADAAGFGTVAGAMEGNGLQERATNALKGGATGLIAGGVLPFGFAGLKAAASPVISNIQARVNPVGYAESQVARGIHETGRAPQQIADDAVQAAREGQGMYTLADAMGLPGQRMLSTVARAPGAGRTAVVDALEARQAGQGRRVSGTLAEGFNAPDTAMQTEARLTRARDTAADREYGAIRTDAEPVDVSNVIAHIDQTLSPYGVAHDVASNDTAAAALASFRSRLTNGQANLNDFNAAQRVRGDLSDAVQQARQAGANNRARLLSGALRELDTSLENASSGFRDANRNFAAASRNIEAVDQGRTAAMRGRTEDTVPTFQALPQEGQQAFRSGYVDPLIAQTQGAAFGANKARPLLNDAFQTEAGAMAPGNPLMQRRLTRENTMFETRNQARGNSATTHNMNDDAAMGAAPELAGFVGNILTGNIHGAMRTALSAGSNLMTGNTPAVREAVADILLQRGGNMNPATLTAMVNQTIERMQNIQRVVANLGRGAAGGLAVEGPGQTRRRQ